MNSVALKSKKNKRYLPHEVTTKVYSVKLYRQTKDIDLVCRRLADKMPTSEDGSSSSTYEKVRKMQMAKMFGKHSKNTKNPKILGVKSGCGGGT